MATGAQSGAIPRGGSGKGLVFKKREGGVLKAPYLLVVRPNFGGLVMVRLKVRNS